MYVYPPLPTHIFHARFFFSLPLGKSRKVHSFESGPMDYRGYRSPPRRVIMQHGDYEEDVEDLWPLDSQPPPMPPPQGGHPMHGRGFYPGGPAGAGGPYMDPPPRQQQISRSPSTASAHRRHAAMSMGGRLASICRGSIPYFKIPLMFVPCIHFRLSPLHS